MNIECELNLAVLLRRTLLPWPLLEDTKFTGRPNRQLRFSDVVNLSGMPVDEDTPWPATVDSTDFHTVTLDPASLASANASSARYLNLGRSPKEMASGHCCEYVWCIAIPSPPLPWAAAVLEAADRVLASPPFRLGGSVRAFDGVHVRGGDKMAATDPLVAVPTLSAAEVRIRILGHLTAGRPASRPLVIVATDTPVLVDSAGLGPHVELFRLPPEDACSTAALATRGNGSGCPALLALAVEMVLLERSTRLVVSEHSNIGRRVIVNRAQRGDEPSRQVRYLYGMGVRRLLDIDVGVGEWELAVKRNDEAAVALRSPALTREAVCAMPRDARAESDAKSRGLPVDPHDAGKGTGRHKARSRCLGWRLLGQEEPLERGDVAATTAAIPSWTSVARDCDFVAHPILKQKCIRDQERNTGELVALDRRAA